MRGRNGTWRSGALPGRAALDDGGALREVVHALRERFGSSCARLYRPASCGSGLVLDLDELGDLAGWRNVGLERENACAKHDARARLEPMSAPEDCTTCGACCFSESARHVRVSGDDYARLGDDAEEWVTWVGNEAYLRLAPLTPPNATEPVHACSALRVDVDGRRFLCALYTRRPDTCRDLDRGSPSCAGEREAKGSRPRRVLAVLASHALGVSSG